jgi:hypothetical protein
MPARRDASRARERKFLAHSLRRHRAGLRPLREQFRAWHAELSGPAARASVPTFRMVWRYVPILA